MSNICTENSMKLSRRALLQGSAAMPLIYTIPLVEIASQAVSRVSMDAPWKPLFAPAPHLSYVCGPTGTGKSTYTTRVVHEYIKEFCKHFDIDLADIFQEEANAVDGCDAMDILPNAVVTKQVPCPLAN